MMAIRGTISTNHVSYSLIFLRLQVELGNYLYDSLSSVPNVRIYGPAPSQDVKRAALCSFNVEGIHPTDVATFLDQQVHNKETSSQVHLLDLIRYIILLRTRI